MDAHSLASLYTQAHGAMRNADGLQPQEAFDELLKYMHFRQRSEGQDLGVAHREVQPAAHLRAQFRQSLESGASRAREAWSEPEIQLSDEALLSVHELFAEVSLGELPLDIRSAALREFMSPELRRGLGIYLTPDEVVRAGITAMAPPEGSTVFDPACGSGTFLVEVARHWAQQRVDPRAGVLLGGDINARMVLLAELNLGHLPDLAATCRVSDALGRSNNDIWPPENHVDYIFTNPPFGVYVDPDSAELLDLDTAREGRARLQSEVLLVERCLRWLRPGGWLSIVVPRSLLTNASLDGARAALDKLGVLRGVMNLPPETFAATGTQTNTCVMFLQKRGLGCSAPATATVHVADITNVGFDTTGRTRPGGQLPAAAESMRRALHGQSGGEGLLGIEVASAHSLRSFTSALNRARGAANHVRLGDLLECAHTGRTPPRTAYADEGVFIVKVGNLTDQGVDWTPRARNYVQSSHVSERLVIQPGDILLTSSAHNPNYIARKVDMVTEVPAFVGNPVTFVGEVMRLRAKPGRIDPVALLAIVRHPTTRAQFRQLIRGQTAHLRPKDLVELRVDESLATADLVDNLREELALSTRISELRHAQRTLYGAPED